MRLAVRLAVSGACAAALAGLPATAWADHDTRPDTTSNMHAKGHSLDFGNFDLPDGQRDANSDLAFWGNRAFVGDYDGFRVVDISDPDAPAEIARARCNGDQGDVVVWRDILVRSWNSPAPAGRTCDGSPVPTGFEGVHVFDISDPSNPSMIDALELECGSHTATLAGVSGGDLIVYSNNSSSSGCAQQPGNPRSADDPLGDFTDVIAVDLETKDARLLRREELAGPTTNVRTGCHDAGVIRGSVNLAACASADTINVWGIGGTRGGTLDDPALLFTVTEPGVGQAGTNGRWHSAAFTWDGEVLIAGWEPGGGGAAECEATDPDVDKSLFFYDTDDAIDDGTPAGTKLGRWVLPNPQGADENCTVHNYNIVPLRSGRYVAVGGNYQAGTWVTEFTDPANPVTLGWSDPPSLGPGAFCGGKCKIGGAWSSYWYNNFIYEDEITKGMMVFRFSGNETGGALRLSHLNPQTQGFSLP